MYYGQTHIQVIKRLGQEIGVAQWRSEIKENLGTNVLWRTAHQNLKKESSKKRVWRSGAVQIKEKNGLKKGGAVAH